MFGHAPSKKLVIVGDSFCGKSSLVAAFESGKAPAEGYSPTKRFGETTIIDTTTNDGVTVELELWDTAGPQDGFQGYGIQHDDYDSDGMRSLSYPNTDVVLIMFDISDEGSLANVENKWMPEVQQFCPDTPVVLVGTKVDLRRSTRGRASSCIDTARGLSVATRIGAVSFVECSAKSNLEVDEVFSSALRACLATQTTAATPHLRARKVPLSTEKPAACWDCRHLSSEVAKARLVGQSPGTFVIRSSEKVASALTLSMIQPDGAQFQIRIYQVDGGYRLNKARALHNDLTALITHHQSERGNLPCLLYSHPKAAPVSEPPAWDCRDLSKADAEMKLKGNPVGSFLVRQGSTGGHALSYVWTTGLRRATIVKRDDHRYGPGGFLSSEPAVALKGSQETFPNLDVLVNFYMTAVNADIPIQLTSPSKGAIYMAPRSKRPPSYYENESEISG